MQWHQKLISFWWHAMKSFESLHVFIKKSPNASVLLHRSTPSRFFTSSFKMKARNVQLNCSPLSGKMDEKVTINMEGLEPNQKVSLQAKLLGDTNDRYHSLAHYIADQKGRVCLNSQPSVGGSYVGIEPMGFMWSLKPEPNQRPGLRMVKRDVTKPYLVNLALLDGHVDILETENCHPLSSLTIKRHYMTAGVRRIDVREGRIRGTLFLPPGDGPFQGVISIHNSFGFLFEDRTSLLASNGFAAFSLGYWGYDDLPKELKDVEVEYFLEAIDWFKNNPYVTRGGVGLTSISSGASKALYLAAHCKDIKPVVWMSGQHKLVKTMKYRGKQLDYYPMDHTKLKQNEDGSISFNESYNNDLPWSGDIKDDPQIIPVENACGPFLLIYGTDDQNSRADICAAKIQKRLEAFGKKDSCTVVGYHGAGHLIYPPYIPPTHISFQKTMGITLNWGGELIADVSAQEDSWTKIKTFFRENLPNNNPKSKC